MKARLLIIGLLICSLLFTQTKVKSEGRIQMAGEDTLLLQFPPYERLHSQGDFVDYFFDYTALDTTTGTIELGWWEVISSLDYTQFFTYTKITMDRMVDSTLVEGNYYKKSNNDRWIIKGEKEHFNGRYPGVRIILPVADSGYIDFNVSLKK